MEEPTIAIPTHESADLERSSDSTEPKDINIVDWESNDPENPMNWPYSKRISYVIFVSTLQLIVNLASTAFAPGAPNLMKDFHFSSSFLSSLTVTIYLLGFAFGPLLIAPLSELYGRSHIYNICNLLFIGFMVGCALATNVNMFLVFRFFAGCAGSTPLTIGAGTIADVIEPERRGAAMGLWAIGPLLGPVCGPIMGAFIAKDIGWRWVFWVLTIAGGVLGIAMLFLMRETFGPVILQRRVKQLRKETGNPDLRLKSDQGQKPSTVFAHSIVRPLKLLFLSPMVGLLSLYTAFVFGLTYLLFTTFPLVFEEQYHFGKGVIGLAYLGLGIGMALGVALFSVASDTIVNKRAKDGKLRPEDRFLLMVYFAPIMPAGFFWYGWSAWAHLHWIVPILGTSLIGIGALFVLMPVQVYLVDAYGAESGASAVAANTVLRCLFGAFLPVAGPYMYDALGLGWGNSLLGFLGLGFAAMPWFFFKYGERLRERDAKL